METTCGKRAICRILTILTNFFQKRSKLGSKSPSTLEIRGDNSKDVVKSVYCNRLGRKINAIVSFYRRRRKSCCVRDSARTLGERGEPRVARSAGGRGEEAVSGDGENVDARKSPKGGRAPVGERLAQPPTFYCTRANLFRRPFF